MISFSTTMFGNDMYSLPWGHKNIEKIRKSVKLEIKERKSKDNVKNHKKKGIYKK